MRTTITLLLLIAWLMPTEVRSQTQEITFRFIADETIVRAFVPGQFNNWGPNNSGVIAVNAVSLMTYVESLEQWIYSQTLQVGQTYEYKIHVHRNEAGTDWQWISDPLNPITNPADNFNSVLAVRDPMAFQPAHELNGEGLIAAVSAGLFSTQPVNDIRFWVNGIERDGAPYFNAETGIFRYVLDYPVKAGSQFKIRMTDQLGRSDSLEIGEVLLPVSWDFPGFSTVMEQAVLKATITRQDGTVDPEITTATLFTQDGSQSVEVQEGGVSVLTELKPGLNTYVLQAMVDGSMFSSDSLKITRKLHPLDAFVIDATVNTSGSEFSIIVTQTDAAPEELEVNIEFDEINSTSNVTGLNVDNMVATGQADGRGELYFDVDASSPAGIQDKIRVGLKVDEDGEVREMDYAETPAWVDNAVVYEIFPLSFGPEATGTESNPGKRLDQIRDNLEFISDMGFNVIWFMPIMKNQFMDQLSGGYNIVDFYNVDPKLGTNEDFKDLVDRAHELGIKVILDITPNHASPGHTWVESLKQYGNSVPPGSFMQTTPNAHNRGLDNRGANLPEIWQVVNGENLYRKYDGFGDLANLNWDNDDLQAEFLNILAYWVREFDIDGWRFDVYWGPWRRYGPERFGRPIRDLMKRIKPDSWILGEIAGTGFSTEVYYADDENGTHLVGGIDAGYDWNFYFNGIKGTYGNISNYDSQARNGNFWPGPSARFFRFLENHDETRIAKTFISNPDRIFPLTGFLLTTTGVPMVYQGQEVNFGNVGGDERRVSVVWDTARNGEFARYHQQLAQARTQFPAFGTQNLTTFITTNDIYAFARPYLDENALVMINFSGETKTFDINPTSAMKLTTDGPITYTHIFSDSSFVDELDGFSLTLAPYETAIFIANGGQEVEFELPNLPALPFGAVYTGSEIWDGDSSKSLTLEQNYPNPFSAETRISFSIPQNGWTQLSVFDILGRQVAALINDERPAGSYSVTFDGSALPAGVYFIRLESAGQISAKQMVLVK